MSLCQAPPTRIIKDQSKKHDSEKPQHTDDIEIQNPNIQVDNVK